MDIVRILLAPIVGLFARLMYGGHLKPVPDVLAYLVFLAEGFWLTQAHGWIPALIVSGAYSASWNPGHGSYADAGVNPKKDNEDVRFLTKALAHLIGVKDAQSLAYDCIGMSVRYGLSTCFIAAAMWACNAWLGSHFNLWIAALGWSGGLMLYALALLMPVKGKDSAQVRTIAQRRWVAFEGTIGAVITTGVAVAAL